MTDHSSTPAIAVVGMACRFPGVSSLDAFWNVLCEGRDTMNHDLTGESTSIGEALVAIRAFGILDEIDQFDRRLFGLTAREARLLDPQHRVWLETVWTALEDAGLGSNAEQLTAVIAGCNISSYLDRNLKTDPKTAAALKQHSSSESRQILNGNDKDFLPLRTSYALGFTGPSLNVQSACSTALVAVASACSMLTSRETDVCIAGGASIVRTTGETTYCEAEAIHSTDGYCRPFDAAANGTVFGDGAGAVVLKRLEDAQAAGDRIYSVIRGWGMTNDGATKASFAAPNAKAQSQAILNAHQMAEFPPDTVGFVEAHGTGTKVGDPIEFEGLCQALEGSLTARCGIGSVKSSIGHLDVAAGIAGLIKTSLMVFHGKLVPTVGFHSANPLLRLDRTRFFITAKTSDWPVTDGPRRAGVSALGVGGTNCHVALESAPIGSAQVPEQDSEFRRLPHLLIFSACSETALKQLAESHLAKLDSANVPLHDYCRASVFRRRHLEFRTTVIGEDIKALRLDLQTFLDSRVPSAKSMKNPRTVFMFSGQLSSYKVMAKQLFDSEPTFERWLLTCEQILLPVMQPSLTEVLFSETDLLKRTEYEQPALFAIQIALAETWKWWGITPFAVLGYSLGEFAAAYVAKMASLEDLLKLVLRRGQIMGALESEAAMYAVLTPVEQLQFRLQECNDVCISAITSPESCVLSGRSDSLLDIVDWMDSQSIVHHKITDRYAFHSAWVDPCLPELAEAVNKVSWQRPKCRFISSVTGALETNLLADADYWINQARQPVRFAQSIETSQGLGANLMLELGPGTTLTDMRHAWNLDPKTEVINSLQRGQKDTDVITHAVARLHCAGVLLNWTNYYGDSPVQNVQLPGYPFERESFWMGGELPVNNGIGCLESAKLPTPQSSKVSFETSWNPTSPHYLSDHQLFGQTVVSAAFQLSWLIYSIREHWRSDIFVLEELIFLNPVKLHADRDTLIHLTFTPIEDKHTLITHCLNENPLDKSVLNYSFEASCWNAEQSTPKKCFLTGMLKLEGANSNVQERSFKQSEYTDECASQITGDDFYERVWVQRENTGDSFRCIEHVWCRENEAVSRVQQYAGASLNGDLHGTSEPISENLACQVIEACFQTLYASTSIESDVDLQDHRQTWVPYTIKSVHYRYANTSQYWWCRAVHQHAERSTSNVVGNLNLYTDEGFSSLVIRGFHLRPLPAESLMGKFNVLACVYRNEFKAAPLDSSKRHAPHPSLIVAPAGPRFSTLVTELQKQSEHSDVIFTNGDELEVKALARVLSRTLGKTENDSTTISVIYLHRSLSSHEAGLIDNVRPLLTLIEQLDECAWCDIELTVCVEFSYSAHVSDTVEGISRVLMNERAQYHVKLVSQSADYSASLKVRNLVDETCHSQDGEEILYQDGERFHCVLQAREPHNDIIKFRDDAAYVIIGPAGEQSHASARWLVEQGAGAVTIAYVAKSSTQNSIAPHSQVTLSQFDPDNEAECDALLSSVARSNRPLAGIFIIPWLMDDAILDSQNWERFYDSVYPLVNGFLNISKSSEKYPIEHFVGFSSSAAVLGSQGQVSYAAACHFLDALCADRRVRNLPGLSINWGPWADMGNWQRDDASEQATLRQGWQLIEPEQAFSLIGRLMNSKETNACVLPMDWRRLQVSNGAHGMMKIRRLAAITNDDSLSTNNGNSTTTDQIPKDSSHSAISSLSELIGEDVSLYPADTLLNELGLDSLMAVSLRNLIQREWSKNIELKALLTSTTLANLSVLSGTSSEERVVESARELGQPTLIPLSENPEREGKVRVFCLEWLNAYIELAKAMGEEYSVCAVWLEEDRDYAALPETTVEYLASRYIEEIRNIQPDGPYLIVGSSFAGLVALEIAQQLTRMGEQIELLALIDTNTPEVIGSRFAKWRYFFNRVRQEGIGPLVGPLRGRLLTLLPCIPSANRPKPVDLRTQYRHRAIVCYKPQPYAGAALLTVAEENSFNFLRPPDLGWTKYINGGLTIHKLIGGHHEVSAQAGAEYLASIITQYLRRPRG